MLGRGRTLRLLLVLAAFMVLAGTPACPSSAAHRGGSETASAVADVEHSHDSGGHGHGCHHVTPKRPTTVGAAWQPIVVGAPAALPVAAPADRAVRGPVGRQSTVDSSRPPGRALLIAHGIART